MKLWSIQVLRFVAALLVTYYHAANSAFEITGNFGSTGSAAALIGRCGVDIFFVISGFIIARTAHGLSASQFLAKRAQRILPLYIILTAPWVVIIALHSSIGWRDVLATALLWPATDRITSPLNPVGWTLCFEALFYASFALTIWKPRAVWLIGAGYLVALVLHRLTPALQFLGDPLSLEFAAGVALAYAPPWRPAILALPIGAAALLLGALLSWPPTPAANSPSGQEAWLRVADLGIPAVLVVWGTLQIKAREGVLTYLGDASYALYLVHVPVVLGVSVLLLRWLKLPADVAIAVSVAASILFAWRIHEVIEKPTLAWLRRKRRQPLPQMAA